MSDLSHKLSEQLSQAAQLGITPVYFDLEPRFTELGEVEHDQRYDLPENREAMKHLKVSIRELTDPDPDSKMAANHLGQFAVAIIRGKLSFHADSVRTGYYGLADDGQSIIFSRPDVLSGEGWQEPKLGIRFRSAMLKLVEASRPKPTS